MVVISTTTTHKTSSRLDYFRQNLSRTCDAKMLRFLKLFKYRFPWRQLLSNGNSCPEAPATPRWNSVHAYAFTPWNQTDGRVQSARLTNRTHKTYAIQSTRLIRLCDGIDLRDGVPTSQLSRDACIGQRQYRIVLSCVLRIEIICV